MEANRPTTPIKQRVPLKCPPAPKRKKEKRRSRVRRDEDADFPVTYISFASSKDPSWDSLHPGTATLEAIVPTKFDNLSQTIT